MNYKTKEHTNYRLLVACVSANDDLIEFANTMLKLKENHYNEKSSYMSVSVGKGNRENFNSFLSSHTEKPNVKLTAFEKNPCFIIYDGSKPIANINLNQLINMNAHIEMGEMESRYIFVFHYNTLDYKISVLMQNL